MFANLAVTLTMGVSNAMVEINASNASQIAFTLRITSAVVVGCLMVFVTNAQAISNARNVSQNLTISIPKITHAFLVVLAFRDARNVQMLPLALNAWIIFLLLPKCFILSF